MSFVGHCQLTNSAQPLIEKLYKQPDIRHYNRTDFESDTQFWTACEDTLGNMYFGNNDGILIYDGVHWNTVVLPNSSSVRSLVKDANGTIYAGGYNELGIVQKDEYGTYNFKSLKETYKLDNFNFENIWQAHSLNEHLIFRTFTKIFVLYQNNLTQIPANNTFLKSFVTNDSYYVVDADNGIYEVNFKTNHLTQVLAASAYQNESIISIDGSIVKNTIHILTENGQLLQYNLQTHTVTSAKNILPANTSKLISCTNLTPSTLLLGTLRDGAIQLSLNNNNSTRPIQNLQGETVLNLFQTSQNNVWVLLDNGLDFIDFNNPKTTIFTGASVYDIHYINNILYVATNQGVYYSKTNLHQTITPESFKPIIGLDGQAWSLNYVHNTLIVGHDKGLFRIHNGDATKIGNKDSFWKIVPVKEKENYYLACHYSGIYVLHYENGNWNITNKIKGFDESSRDILEAEDPYTFWVCHGYKGVYRITLNSNLERATAIAHFTDSNGLDSPFNINVFKWNNQIVFTTNTGIFNYKKETNSFKPFQALNKIVDTTRNTRKILQENDRTWVIQDDELGYFETFSKTPQIHKDIFSETKGTFNRGMESILPISKKHILIGTHTGLYLYEINENNDLQEIPISISGIQYTAANTTKRIPLAKDSITELPNNTTSIHFEFSVPKMPNSTPNLYSYQLKNIDKSWSNWQSMPFKEYNLLPAGTYTFRVRARNTLGIQTTPASFTFTILPKWYQTKLAFFLYVILGISSLFLVIILVKRKIRRENQKTREHEQKTNRLLQLEVNQLKLENHQRKIQQDNEHLEQDVIKKSKELATYTMMLVNKKNFFTELQIELRELRDTLKTKNSRQKITDIFSKLHQHRIDEEYLKVFEENFETVHQDFFKNLKQTGCNLSVRETRLAAFIKTGLTNKEIAPLLNISVRGVETARYRLRKKLDLRSESSLTDFLNGLTTKETTDDNHE
ncbi:hypothetical protein Y10_17640 [Neptunitalea sp. Y10]|uniref:HTH luxR-type domain-containing protein n=2 Tax=Neptunitalea lumnitzerae TaxID=2965509 RepID=A0ABQ5MJ01_9FLAO|nr:hypothetical protein Y10_17640 [Neptunitalea sp. Y10]